MESGNVRHTGVDEFSVNLVAEQIQIVFLDYIPELKHFLAGIEIAGRIVGVADEDSLGLFGNLLLKSLNARKTETILDTGLHAFDHSADRNGKSHIVCIERVGHDHLVTRAQAGQKGEEHGLRTTCSDDNLIRRKVDAVLRIILDHLGPECQITVRGTIFQDFPVDVLESVKRTLRSLDVRLADVKVINVYTISFCIVCVLGQLPDWGRWHIQRSL